MAGPTTSSTDYQGIINNATQGAQDQVDKFNQNYASGMSGLLANQDKQTQDYLTGYKNAVSALPDEQTLYQQIGASQNLPQLQQLASQANIAVSNLPRDELTYARTNAGGGGLDQNQLQQLTQQKLYDLSPIAQRATQQYQDAQQLVAQQMQYAIDQQNRSLLPYQQQGQLLSDALNRQMTGFTAQNQAQLDALTAKLNMTGTLTGDELQQMTQLAYQENEYHNQSALQQQQAGLNYGNSKNLFNYQQSVEYPQVNLGQGTAAPAAPAPAPASNVGGGWF